MIDNRKTYFADDNDFVALAAPATHVDDIEVRDWEGIVDCGFEVFD